VDAVIADSPYDRLGAYLRRAVPVWTGLPAFPFAWTVPWVMARETGVAYGRFSPLADAAALGSRPLLLVVGTADPLTPPSGVRALLAAAHDVNAQILSVPGAGHLGAFAAAPNRYLAAVMQTLAEMR